MKILKKLLSPSFLAIVGSFAIFSSAQATTTTSAPGGTWTAAQCGTARAVFDDNADGNGFGSGDADVILVNAGDGNCGVQLFVDYGTDDRTNKSDFRLITIKFRDSNLTRNLTNVHFCFLRNHGTGNVLSTEKKLGSFSISSNPNGWFTATATSRDFGGQDVRSMTLVKVTVAVPSRGNLAVGDTMIQYANGTLDPSNIAFDTSDCSILGNCNNVPSGEP